MTPNPLTFSFFLILLLFISHTLNAQLVRIPFQKLPKKPSNPIQNFLSFPIIHDDTKQIHNYWSIEYVGNIRVGSHKKEFKVLLDTGSAPLWIPDISINDTTVEHSFDCSLSETCTANDSNTHNISYGIGSVLGFEAIDQVTIGGVTVPKHNMLLATKIDKIPNAYYDGILGLSLGRWSKLKSVPTLLENMKESGAIQAGTFSMFLGNDQNSIGEVMGEIIFGGYDPKYAQSEFKFIPVSSGNLTLLWTANMTALSLGAYHNVSDITDFPVIFDSGSSMSIFPETFIKNIVAYAALKGVVFTYNKTLNLYLCDCDSKYTLPNLFFHFEGASFDIPASSYILSNGYCYLGLLSLREEIGFYNPAVLGDVFLNDHYALYTMDNNTVGLTKAVSFKPKNTNVPLPVIFFCAFIALLALFVFCMQDKGKKKKRQTIPEQFNNILETSLGKKMETEKLL